jgi:aminopeptidase
MLEPTIDRRDLETWAGFLLDHSLGGVAPGDRVMVKGERICWPLMEILERRVIAAGAVPDVYLVPPNNDRGRVWSAAMGRSGSEAQLGRIPDWHRSRYESMTKYVEVLGAEDPAQFTGLEPRHMQALAASDRPFADIRLSKPWVITLYPTPGFAAIEGMDLDEYTRFIVRASTEDPRLLKEAEERIAPLVEHGRRVEIVTEHPRERRELTLELDITPSRAQLCYGLRNFPDGEVFTSPDARSTRGEIFLDLPVTYGGNDIRGIYLRFADGRIVEHRADVGSEYLAAIVETDEGSRRLGEVALGMNPGLDRVLKHPLFVEKVGGTLHVAIGASYEDSFVEDAASEEGRRVLGELERCGALNRSAQHVDIVADFRPGGCGRSVRIDGNELVVRGGVWATR